MVASRRKGPQCAILILQAPSRANATSQSWQTRLWLTAAAIHRSRFIVGCVELYCTTDIRATSTSTDHRHLDFSISSINVIDTDDTEVMVCIGKTDH